MVKKKSGIVFNLLIILVLVVGVGLLAYPTVSNWWNTVHASRAIAQYNEMVDAIDAAEVQEMLDAARAYNRDLVMDSQRFTPSEEDSARYDSLLDISGTGIMGYVEIPKISVDLPIITVRRTPSSRLQLGTLRAVPCPLAARIPMLPYLGIAASPLPNCLQSSTRWKRATYSASTS